MPNSNDKMDKRCPRALKSMPSEWCPLAVMRLRAIRTAGRELSEEEESRLPGCFLPDTLVKTLGEWKSISEIGVGDLVWTHKGRWRKVLRILPRHYDGEIFHFSHNSYLNKDVWMTHEHPALVSTHANMGDSTYRFDAWVRAGHIRHHKNVGKSHYTMGKLYFQTPKNTVSLSSYDSIFPAWARGASREDFLWLCGLWVAEGSVTLPGRGYSCVWSLSFEEKDTLAIRVCEIAEKIGLRARVRPRERKAKNGKTYRGCDVYITSKNLHTFLVANFGKYCHKKRVPLELWNSVEEDRKAFFDGLYDGDGSKTTINDVDGDSYMSLDMCSRAVISWLQHHLLLVGLCKPVIHTHRTGTHRKTHYSVSWSIKSKKPSWFLEDKECFLFSPTRCTSKRYAGMVYDLEVEEDSSFNVGFSVHNCSWAVNHQLANYCFFKYIRDYAGDKAPSDVEIASLNCISVEAVKQTERIALNKIRQAKQFEELENSLDEGESVVSEFFTDEDYKIFR
jgi:hypothetical protein